MRIGIRLAISGLVLASIIITAAGVHLLWWRTAEANSHALAATIDEQIVSAVQKEVDSITTQARAAHTAIRTLFVQNVLETREADKREFVFLSQLQAQPSISWVAFGWPDDAFFAAHKLGDLGLEMMEIGKVDGVVKRRIDEYRVVVGDIEFQKRRFENTDYKVTDQEWYKKSIAEDEPSWFEVSAFPVGLRPSIAYAGPIDVYQKRQGVLAVIIENTRLAQFLSQLSVGKTGAAFILGRDGAVIAAPDPDADEVHMQRHDQPLLRVAQMALKETGSAGSRQRQVAPDANGHRRRRLCRHAHCSGLCRLDARHGHSRGGIFGPDRDDHPALACRPGLSRDRGGNPVGVACPARHRRAADRRRRRTQTCRAF